MYKILLPTLLYRVLSGKVWFDDSVQVKIQLIPFFRCLRTLPA